MSNTYYPPSVELRVLLTPSEMISMAALGGVPWVRLNDQTLWAEMHRDPRLRRYVTLSASDGVHGLVRQYITSDQCRG